MGAPDWREGSIPKAPLPTCSDRLFTLRDYPGLTLKVRSPPGAPFVLGKPEQMVILIPPRRANRVTPRHPDANLPGGRLTPAQRLPQAPAWSGPWGEGGRALSVSLSTWAGPGWLFVVLLSCVLLPLGPRALGWGFQRIRVLFTEVSSHIWSLELTPILVGKKEQLCWGQREAGDQKPGIGTWYSFHSFW